MTDAPLAALPPLALILLLTRLCDVPEDDEIRQEVRAWGVDPDTYLRFLQTRKEKTNG